MLDWLKATGRIFALFLGVFAVAAAAQAGPEDGRIVNGSGSISQSGTHTDIRQNSDFLATHWGSFNIAAHESVQAHQPGASSRLLIRVDGGGGTNIAGSYTSNGITILENQNGVQFSRGAIVNVGGLLATSSRISGADGAHWQLNGTGGAVVNHGQIAAGAGGVVLAAVRVENHGKITAQGGDVALGAGSAFTVDFAGSLVGFEVKKAADGASVVHDGVIESQGGIVSLSAQEAQAVRTNVVSVGGVVKATRLERRGGVVYLSGGTQGIAEVSGDVSASDKVQTTGEYVVVKEGALLKAPEILVGGDFQGGGDVQTAQRTLVERGALLNAGAGGRVIVWSDDVTWFNGDISAPGGFAEVSGKETLASVNLAGIDVGELLLDPTDIIIAASGTGVAVTADIAAADPGTTVTLNVATINSFAGALSLAASDTIMVDGEILKPTGNLTLIAGGVLTINANITTSVGDLALTGASIALTAATTTLTGGAISLTGVINETGSDARNLTINASGIVTLNSDITLPTGGITGRLEITAFRVNLPSAIALAPSRLFIVFNDPAAVDFEASFDGAGVAGSTFPGIVSDIIRTIFTYAPRDCGGEAVCELTSMDNVDEIGQGFRLSPTLSAETSITITGRGFVLTFGGTGPISITAPTVSIESRAINIGGRNFTITANGGTLTLGTSITTTGNITLSSTGANAGITLMFNTGLEGRDISITGAIDEPSGATNSFTATASGRLTLNDNINVGTNGLVLTGTGGITLANAAGLTLRGGAVTLTGVVTAANLPLTIEAQQGIVINNNIDIGAGRLELIAGLGDGGTAFINVHDARPDPDDDTVRLTITAGSFLWAQDAQFNASDDPPANFMLPDEVRIEGIYFGTDTSAVDPAWLDVRQFQGVRYMLGDGMGDVVVPQAATSALESITLNAAADSTISFGGTGAITLTAPLITITAGTIIIGEGRTLTITAEGGTLTLNLDDIIISGSATAGSVTLSAAAIVNNAALILNVATVNIAQDGEFGAAAPFTFPAGVTTLNLSTRSEQVVRDWMIAVDRDLTITSSERVVVNAAIGSMAPNRNIGAGALSLTSTGGVLRIIENISTTGDLTLSGSTGINLNGGTGTTKTLTGANVTLRGAAVSNRDLNILATGSRGLTLGGDINAGASDISLAATVGDIILGGDVVLTGGAVSLVGGVDGTMMGGNHGLRVNANDDITLTSSSIDLGAGALNLRAGEDDTGNIVLAGTASTLTVGDLTLQQVEAFGNTQFDPDSRASGAAALRLRTAVDQPIHLWMTLLGIGAFSLRGVDGVTLTSIITTAALNQTGGEVDLQAATITLGGNVTGGNMNGQNGITLIADTINLTANVMLSGGSANINLTGVIDESGTGGNENLTFNLAGFLRLNSDINLGTGNFISSTGAITLGGNVTITGGEVTLPGSITQSTSAANNANFTVNASTSLTIGTVNLGTSNLILNNTGAGGIALGASAAWTAGDITLTGVIDDSTPSRSLTITAGSGGRIVLNSAAITIRILTLTSDGDITFTHANGLTLTNALITLNGDVVSQNLPFTATSTSSNLTLNGNINTGTGNISLNGGAFIVVGADVVLTGGNVMLTSPGVLTPVGASHDLRVLANGDITLDIGGTGNINIGTGLLDLRAGGSIINSGTARAIEAGDVFLQADAFADNLFAATGNNVSGSVSLRATVAVTQVIHPWMTGLGNGDFSLRGEGVVLNRITISAAFTRSAGEVDLRATSIIFNAPLTGTSVILRTNSVLQSGTTNPVAIRATAGDITSTAINTSTGEADTGLPALSFADSFTLEQTSAFGGLDTLPFEFAPPSITGAIILVTRSEQVVRDWMIAEDRDLTITSSERVVVDAAIGSMAPNRNIGAGALSLTSTGAAVRIFADISTTRRLTLSGVIGGINFNNRAAKTLTGLSVTLRGAAVSNRALTITASSPSGFVTISGGINTGTSDLSLSTGSGGGIVLDSGDVELRGGVITLGGVVRGDNNSGLSVFANGNIILGGEIALGSGALTLSAGENGTGNISFLGIAQNQLTVGALTLRQSDAFGDDLFDTDSRATGAAALRLRTAVGQIVHPWMTGLGDGGFSLRGVDGITLISIITTAALTRSDGPVDLRATTINLGGDVTGNIVGSSDVELVGLTLTATTINLGGDVTANIGVASNANIRLTGVINGSANNRNFSATASRMLTISNDINIGMGTLTLTGVGLGVTGSILLDGNITFTGGEIRFIGDFRPSAADINPNLTVNASTSISIRNVNLGTGNLILNNTGATATALGATNTTWTTGDITLTGALDASADNRNLNIIASGVLTLNNDINLGERNLNINAMGGITLGGNVTLTSRVTILRGAVDGTNGNHNFTIMDSAGSNLHNDINLGSGTFTLANTGSGQVNFSIVGSVGAPLTIEAGNINFMRSNDVVWVLQAGVVAQGADLTLRATGDITFQGTVINLGPGRLEMSADNEGNGTGTIIAANTPQILVGSLVLRHAAAFPADFMADDSAITGEADLRITGAMVTQAIHPWMELDGTSFTLRGDEGEGMRAAVVLTAITLPAAIDFGTTDIDLQAAAITLTAATTLTGGAISLTGAIDASANNRNLTITAMGLLTLNNNITLGTGILTITAGNRINVPNSGTAITAGTISIEFTDRLVQSNEVGFTPAGGTSTFGNAIFEPPFTPTEMPTFAPSPCLADPCSFGDGTTEDLIVDSLLEAEISITIDIGTGALTFGGEGAITITSAAISITAGSIDIGTRSLTIMAADGTITLVGVTSITGTGTASLSLDATTIAGLSSALTVNVPSISLAQEAAFGTAPPVTFGMAVTSLTIEVAAAQTVQGWMVASGRSLDITTSNVLTVDTAITGFILGDSADLTLNGMGGITLTGSGAISLTARDITLSSAGNITFNQNLTLTTEDITLNGAIDGTNGNDDDSDDRNFTVTASGGITLRSDINLGTGDLSITSTFSGGPSPIVISREGGTETAPALVTLSGGNVTLANTSAGGISGPIAGGVGLIVNALDNIILNTAIDGISALTLRADESNSGTGTITNDGTARRIQVGALFLQQAGAFGETSLFASNSSASGDVTLLISRPFNQTIHPWMVGLGGTSFTLRGAGMRRLDTITLPTALTYTGTIELHATTIALGGNLTATSIALRTNTLTRDSTDLVITATTGEITATRIDPSGDAVAGVPTLDSTVTTLTLTQNSAFGSSAPFAFGTTLTSLTLQTAAPQTAYSWMGVSGSNVSLTSTGGDITIGGNINVGTENSLTLIASGNILPGTPRPGLIADTVNLELTGADSAFTSRPFLGTSQIDTLTITTVADQTYLVWMAPPAGTDRNLTITAPRIFIGATAINLGTGDLTLTSDTDIRLTNTAGLTITAGDFTFSAISVNDVDVNDIGSIDISLFAVVASGDIMISAINLPTARVDLRAGGNITVDTRFESIAGEPGVSADILLLQQAGAFAEDLFSNTASRVSGAATLRITTAVPQTIHPWMTNLGGSTFSLRGEGAVLTSITTAAAADFGTAAINLRATDITLGGALTGGVVALRTNTITVPGALAAIHATAGDITAITITDMGDAGTGRPTLTTSATSLSLEQTSAFGARITLPFIFDDAVIGTALTLSTRSEQLVRGWMIRDNINLTITSSDRVVVDTAIGSGNRSLGGGDLTLTSTGAAVRIVANITTGGAITLSGGTGGINLNSTPTSTGTVTLTGAAITLSGNALSNRNLILTAMTGALTLSGAITATASDLVLTGGTGGIALGGALTLTVGSITINNAITGAANASLTITADTLTLNNDITLTGTTSILALRSRQGAITGGAVLRAPTVRLRQAVAFADTEPFNFSTTGSLLLITDTNQEVHDWMIALDRNLTVRSQRRVRVMMGGAIGPGLTGRDLGTGSLTLRSTGGAVRIVADIATGGDVTLTASGTLTINNPITLTGDGLTLALSSAGAISNGDNVGPNRPALTASTVSFTQDAAFATTGPFRFGAATGSLVLTTDAVQDVYNWMLVIGRNLTVTSALQVRVGDAIGAGNRNLGGGDLTLTSTGGAVRIFENISTTGNITLNGATGINFNSGAGAKTLSGAAITLSGVVVSNRDLTLDATTDALRVENNITLTDTSNLTLMSATVVRIFADISTTGDITLRGSTIGINFNNRGAKTLSGAAIMLTGAAVSNRDLTIIATDTLTLNDDIIATGTSALSLSGSSVSLGGALTLTGGDITLTGAATGSANLTLDASGTLRIDNDITLTGDSLTLALSGAGAIVGVGRPLLTAGTVSFTQNAAFAAARSFGLIADSLEFTTTVNQDVHNWMIRENTNLTVTSSDRVRVLAAIGSGVDGRNLGTGSLTLTSTGRIVRIVADISTTGDATITASSILTINNDINIGTGALILEATSFAIGSNVDLAAGSHSFTPNMACNTGTSPSCTVNTP